MTTGTSVQPDCCQSFTCHLPFSLISASVIRNDLCLVISPTAFPFMDSAPVGQACTHLPQLVQDSASPHGCFRSVITHDSIPRAITSQVCAPSISPHTRTQRV